MSAWTYKSFSRRGHTTTLTQRRSQRVTSGLVLSGHLQTARKFRRMVVARRTHGGKFAL